MRFSAQHMQDAIRKAIHMAKQEGRLFYLYQDATRTAIIVGRRDPKSMEPYLVFGASNYAVVDRGHWIKHSYTEVTESPLPPSNAL